MGLKKFSQMFEADIKDTLPEDYIKGVRDKASKYMGGPTRQEIMEMMQLSQKIMRLQSGNEEELTEIGKEILLDHYGRMLEDVELDIKIVDPNDEEKKEMVDKMLDEDEDDEPDYDSDFEVDIEVDKDEIDRRKLINSIMQGEAQNVHSMIYSAKEKIDEINPELVDLYLKFLEINRKFDWDENRPALEDMMKQRPEFANAMETDYPEEGEEDGKVKIKARVLDLPMLIHETVKGIYELMAAKAIPEDPVMAEHLLKKTDTLKDEEEDIKYGPFIAADLRDYINDLLKRTTDAETQNIPNVREFIFSKMMELPANIFVQLIKDILTGNKEDADKVLRGGDDLVKQAILNALGEIDGYEEEIEEVSDEVEDEMLKPRERDLSQLSKREINDMINKALDEEDFDTVKKLSEYL